MLLLLVIAVIYVVESESMNSDKSLTFPVAFMCLVELVAFFDCDDLVASIKYESAAILDLIYLM